jgi:serine/threonine protein kinase
VYGAGCVLYEMLTGVMAFGGANLREVLAKQAAGRPTPVNQLRPEVPPSVVSIVERALATRPEDRYQSAGDLAADLRIAMGEPARFSTPAAMPAEQWHDPGSEPAGSGGIWGRVLVIAAAAALLALGVTRISCADSDDDRADATRAVLHPRTELAGSPAAVGD